MKKTKSYKGILVLFILSSLLIFILSAEATAQTYQDIGLRFYDGTKTISIAVEPEGTLTSPLRIAKSGKVYGVVLVDPSDPLASKTRILTKLGVKSLAIWYEDVLADETEISPFWFRRSGCQRNFLVTLKLSSSGIGKNDIANTPLTLYSLSYPGSIVSGSPSISGTSDTAKVEALFQAASFWNLVPGWGEFKVKVVGSLKSGQPFYGIGTIYITKFVGC